MAARKPVGLYLHIPFCVRKCAYCDFASYAGRETDMPAYIARMQEEILEKSQQDAFEVQTLYIGGGTPSLLPAPLMEELLATVHRCFPFAQDAECSCECNPGTLTRPFLAALRRGGMNRLSLGAQTSQPELLQMLGRIHTWKQVEESVALCREMGFQNLNLDLMLGLPGQSEAMVHETLEQALRLSPTHLSCYGLILEEGTRMKAQVDAGIWQLPEEETERRQYECCREMLLAHGFQQYEISNFALPGYACRHNVDCWKRREYLGIGSAACGFLGAVRYQNPPSLSDYLAKKPAEETRLSPEDERFESMMLGLRMMEGVSERAFEQMHGVTIAQAFGSALQKPLQEGLIEWQNGFVRLTRGGMDMQNRVLVELL